MLGNTDRDWKSYGKNDPYYGVLSDDGYSRGRMDDEARRRFFESGAAHVDSIFAELRSQTGVDPAPARALDFGCGVGRLTIPLAGRCGEVVGVDISEAMLAEASRNASAAGVTNAEFVISDDALSAAEGSFDLVHSFIVFQHISPARGVRIFAAMLEKLRPGGLGVVHFTYAKDLPPVRRIAYGARRHLPFANRAANLVRGRPADAAFIQMNDYDLNRIFGMLQDHGCGRISVRLTDHGGFRGAVLFFQRVDLPSL
ncbi:MAG TPA: class I SAM-dependent methyltransferase [Longimicrobiaceae bacterium]|jgi:SAM-dependent methyltransferase|nr:class I SAM-dependent methyltransferase [Longimicrobiaceae bacterium]